MAQFPAPGQGIVLTHLIEVGQTTVTPRMP
jgi:hypothetical protein